MSAASTVWTDGHFIGGAVPLDFANTVFRRTPEPGPDLLNGERALASWLVRAGVLTARDAPFPASELDDARRLRCRLWAVFEAQRDGSTIPAADLTEVLGTAARGSDAVDLGPDGSMSSRTVPGALAAVALHAVTLLMHPPTSGIRACDRCGWFFVDASRGRRRRWCSMATCGNQAKAERFRTSHPDRVG